ncbi:hypothetical protein BGZ73_008953, partial [Actinomortierella ambigua]
MERNNKEQSYQRKQARQQSCWQIREDAQGSNEATEEEDEDEDMQGRHMPSRNKG